MRRALVLAAALVLLSIPSAAAEPVTTLEATAAEAPMLRPGGQDTATASVRYCYNSATIVAPATITLSVGKKPAWVEAEVSPASFRADAGGQRCNTREVNLTLRATRDAPAFKPESVELTASSSSGSGPSKVPITVQVGYGAELELAKPQRPRIERGDQGTISLRITIGANEGTRLEITGRDPQNVLNLAGMQVTTTAGAGLDQKVTETPQLRVTASPGASPGVHSINITVASQYARSPTITGETESILAEVEVVAGSATTPAPAALLVVALAGALAWARRRRA